MTDRADVPPKVVEALRAVCLALPDAHEEDAYCGVRWRIRANTFAHVLTVVAGKPQAYARASGEAGAATLLMFRSSGPELDALRAGGQPFFAPVWRADEVGMVLRDDVDWDEVAELVTDSYCLRAPKKLAATVRRPPGGEGDVASRS